MVTVSEIRSTQTRRRSTMYNSVRKTVYCVVLLLRSALRRYTEQAYWTLDPRLTVQPPLLGRGLYFEYTMHVQVNNYALIVVCILGIGYVSILLSLINPKDKSDLKDLLKVYQMEIQSKQSKIQHLENRISSLQAQSAHTVVITASPTSQILHTNYRAHRDGLIVLGMHRSGTSIIGGLINRMGFQTGGPLIQPAKDNEKGFFERIDVVLQNDEFFRDQLVHYSFNTQNYDPLKALRLALTREQDFGYGKEALLFLNDPKNYPYMLKDPRLCITLRTWLPLLRSIPAILFTFRHPLDVALSLHNREQEQFRIVRGLRLWYVYNRRAIQNSQDLCRVVTSHRVVMSSPKQEMDRIYQELRDHCGVDVPRQLSAEDVASFVDVKLQHGRSGLVDDSCQQDMSSIVPPSTWPDPSEKELVVYRKAMRAYCAMESGEAFHPSFEWDLEMNDA